MPIQVRCPSCKKLLKARDDKMGQKVRCPNCKSVLVIPQASASAAKAPATKAPAAAAPPPPKKSPPPTPRDEWYVNSYDGNQYGPITKAELDGWVAESSVTADCQVRQEGAGGWRPAPSVYPQLAAGAAAAPAVDADPLGLGAADPLGPDLGGATGFEASEFDFGESAPAGFDAPAGDVGDSAFNGAAFNPAMIAPVPASELGKYHAKHVSNTRIILERECGKISGASVLSVVGIPLKEERGKSFWSQIGFSWGGTSDVDPDLLVVGEVACPGGNVTVVSPVERSMILPHEIISFVPGRVPTPIALERGAWGGFSRGNWVSAFEGEGQGLCEAANQNKKLTDGVAWNWQISTGNSTTTINLSWTFQAVPLGVGHYMYLVKTIQQGVFFKNFRLQWYLERRQHFMQFAAAHANTPGSNHTSFVFPTDTIVPLIMKLGEPIAGAHQFG